MKFWSLFIGAVFAADSHGWNDNIDWVTLDEAKEASKTNGKPTMLVIHKSWCGACKSLKPKFAEDKDIEKLSSKFNMVNALDDDEPKGAEFTPDGGYIPRILFLDTDGNVMKEKINVGGNDKYKYYYPSTAGIVKSMGAVSKDFKHEEL